MGVRTKDLTTWDKAAGAVLGFGALNWGLVGLAKFDLIRAAFGKTAFSRLAYALVGAAGVYALIRGRQLVAD